jgi:hypothetical protein
MSALAATGDLTILWVILAFIAFGVAIWLTTLHNIIGAIVCALIGVVILVVGLGAG